jgi:PAS domain S-box-containing protein
VNSEKPDPRQARVFDAVLSSITDFAYTFDRRGRFTYVNKALLDLWGLALERAIGKNFFDLRYPDELAAKLQRQIEEVFQTGKPLFDETPYVSPTGAGGYFEYIFVPVFTPEGEVEAVAGSTRDITRRKRAEDDRERLLKQVEAERERLSEIIHQSPAFMCVLRGPAHVFEIVNDRYARLVGNRDLLGKTVRQAFPEIEGQGFFELLDEVYRTGKPFVGSDVRVSLQATAGAPPAEHCIEFVYQALHEADGSVSGVFVHGVDLTEIKRHEARLARDATLLANVRDSVIVTDLEGIVTFWNEGASRLFGYSAAETVGRANTERFAPEQRPGVEELTRCIAAGEMEFAGEWLDRRKDGTPIWIEAETRRIHDASGNPMGVMGVSRDISDRKRNEEILRENSERFRQLADAMPQIVFAATADGNVDYFNRKWYEYTGIPEGEVGFESWRHTHEPEHLERVVAVWERSLRTGAPYEIEYRLRRADGQFRWHLGRALPVRDARGEIVRWFGTNTDIHDAKILQEQNDRLLESERAAHAEAEAASRAKDRFLAVLSHELRTPLSPVVMSIAAMEIDPDLPLKFHEDVAMIRRNIELEVKLIDDLLDLSRVASGKLRLHPQPVRVHEILRHVLQSSVSDMAAKRLDLVSHLDAADDRVTADPARLQQVFWNILRNAAKFTPERGRITVRTGNGPSESGTPQLVVELSDTGAGIAPEQLWRIFDAFEQGDMRTTRQFGGLGLGLAIAKAVVEIHGGTIHAASEGEGRGATFTVRLNTTHPATTARAGDDAAPAPATRPSDTAHRVLLVEDHPDSARTLARLLAGAGYEVQTAHSVAAALHLASASPFDVMVSDIGLPDGTGYELMAQIRDQYAIPGIALSGFGMEDDLRKGRDAGFEEYVVKPVSVAHIDRAIRRILGAGGKASKA